MMAARPWSIPKAVLIFWLAAMIAVPIWITHDSSAWDMRVYATAMDSLRADHDPYSDATNIQKQHHAERLANAETAIDDAPPYSYVYSPITLPLLRVLGHIPPAPLALLYWLIYIAGALTTIAVGVSFASTAERTPMLYAAALAPFFPGLLANGTVLSGNIAYILYAAVLAAATVGWKKNVWRYFYVAVLLATCVKAPLLSLALIPALSARKQWWPTIATLVAGVALFACQPLVWPTLFKHYLEAVELQFSFNQDFGCSPAGLVSQLLAHHGIPYSPASYFVYCGYAIPLFAALVYLSRLYLRGGFALRQWAPVLLLGIILLNPRIMEYDVAPITVPLALLAWRITHATSRPRLWTCILSGALLLMNAASLYSWEWRKALDGPLVVVLFLTGCWMLLREARQAEVAMGTPLRVTAAS
jgi:hypothetical protein